MKLKIKDVEWEFKVLPKRTYEKENGKTSYALTVMEDKIVEFHEDYVNIPIILHELAHVYFTSCCTISSSDYTKAEIVEEIFAEIWQYHFTQIWDNANIIYEELLDQKSLINIRRENARKSTRKSAGKRTT